PHSKTPLLKSWPKLASSDPSMIRLWAAKYPQCNWATLCGQDFWVLDVDGEHGEYSLSLISSEHGGDDSWTWTLTARTADGKHLYYRHPEDQHISTSHGKLGAGLDVQAHGAYCIIPPSIHPDGVQYEWVDRGQAILPTPTWLLETLAKPE